MIKQLGGLIILGSDFKHLAKYFTNDYPDKDENLLDIRNDL